MDFLGPDSFTCLMCCFFPWAPAVTKAEWANAGLAWTSASRSGLGGAGHHRSPVLPGPAQGRSEPSSSEANKCPSVWSRDTQWLLPRLSPSQTSLAAKRRAVVSVQGHQECFLLSARRGALRIIFILKMSESSPCLISRNMHVL